MANSTLQAIRTKVRRLTRSPSVFQLSDADIDEYVNTFILYDFPEHLRLFDLKRTFTFFTQPNIDNYPTNTTDVTNPLFNFKNKYITVHTPIFIAGYQVMFTQDRTQFYGNYPQTFTQMSIGVNGNGILSTFTGFLTDRPLLQNTLSFNSKDVNNVALASHDVPPANNASLPTIGLLRDAYNEMVWNPGDFIDYVTGQYQVTFAAPPAPNAQIQAQYYAYVASRPQSILYFDDAFTIRPVPDQAYRVQMEVFVRPTQLLIETDTPELEQWWQYIAYGAAKKVFEDRQDLDSVSLILPEYHKQELLVLRKTIVQQTQRRVATIYSEGIGAGSNWGWGWGGGSF